MIIIDTETTGLIEPSLVPLDKQPQIIEFAGVKLDDETLEEISRLEFLVNPGKLLPAKIIKITGLKDGDLKGKPTFAQYLPDLQSWFLGEKTLVAHNASFDVGMLKLEMERMGKTTQFPWPPNQVCTVRATTHIQGHRLKLSELHQIATGRPHKDAHRAMADVEALTRCVRWLNLEGMI